MTETGGGGCPNYRVYPWWCPFLRAAFDSIRYQCWLLYTTPFCCYGRIKTFVLPKSTLVARQCHYEHCQFGNVADGVTKDGFLMMRIFCWLDLFNCELIVHYSIWTVTVIGSTFSHDEHSSTKINISHFIRARFLSYDPLSLCFFFLSPCNILNCYLKNRITISCYLSIWSVYDSLACFLDHLKCNWLDVISFTSFSWGFGFRF